MIVISAKMIEIEFSFYLFINIKYCTIHLNISKTIVYILYLCTKQVIYDNEKKALANIMFE